MMMTNITKKQHYVPQIYLRGFSGDKTLIWSYSLNSINQGKIVPIDSICRENYLYEIRDENGEFNAPNYVEHILCELEGTFATYLRRIEAKAFHKGNYKTKCFLQKDEKVFWKVYVAVQMMRDPQIINTAYDVTKDFFGGFLDDNIARTIAVSQCLPFFSDIKTGDKNVFSVFLKPLTDMYIAIGVDEDETIFTSDNPIYCYSSNGEVLQIEEYDKIVMPLTSKLVLFLLGNEEKKAHDKNRLFPLNEDEKEAVKKSVTYSARSWIFSKYELQKKDKETIEQARMEKAQYEIKS